MEHVMISRKKVDAAIETALQRLQLGQLPHYGARKGIEPCIGDTGNTHIHVAILPATGPPANLAVQSLRAARAVSPSPCPHICTDSQ